MPKRKRSNRRRQYDDEMKAEAAQMMLDGHSAESVATRLGLSGTNILYRWKASQIGLILSRTSSKNLFANPKMLELQAGSRWQRRLKLVRVRLVTIGVVSPKRPRSISVAIDGGRSKRLRSSGP